jgi:hypothetical protein
MKLARVLLVLLVLSLKVTAPTEASESKPAGSLSEPSSPQAKASVLFDVEIERTAEETKVHLKADGAIKDYREARLKKNVAAHRPDRMYLDLKNLRLAGPIPARQAGTALSRVRTGLRADGVRVVFDSNLDELFNYTISEQPDGLLVTIRETSGDTAVIAEMMPGDESEAEPEKVITPAVATMRPEPKAAGDLDLLIVAADTPEQTQEWLDGSPERKTGLQILKTAKPDQVINTSFLVTGVSSDSNGDFSVAVSFTLLDPDGKLVLSERRFAKTSGRAPANPAFIMADPVLGIILGESDPAGEYTIIGLVEDLTNNKVVRTSLKIALEK